MSYYTLKLSLLDSLVTQKLVESFTPSGRADILVNPFGGGNSGANPWSILQVLIQSTNKSLLPT